MASRCIKKNKFMTNIDTTDNIQIDETERERMTNYKYLRQMISMENRTRQEVSIRIKVEWGVFGRYREIVLDMHLPISLKRKGIKPVCLTSNDIWMPNMFSYKGDAWCNG